MCFASAWQGVSNTLDGNQISSGLLGNVGSNDLFSGNLALLKHAKQRINIVNVSDTGRGRRACGGREMLFDVFIPYRQFRRNYVRPGLLWSGRLLVDCHGGVVLDFLQGSSIGSTSM